MALIEALAIGAGLAALTLGAAKKMFPAGSGRVDRDTDTLRAEMSAASDELIPLGREELNQLAYNRREENVKTPAGLKYRRGTLNTIYYEPWAVYGNKVYGGLGKTVATTVIRTRNFELVYKERGKRTTVEINGRVIGLLTGKTLLGGKKMNEELARITVRPGSEYFPIHVAGREVGGLTNRQMTDQPLPRLFQFLQPIEAGQLAYLLAVVLPELFE